MKILDLPVELREKLGSANARRYRRAGKIPVNLYGAGKPNVNLVTEVKSFEKVGREHTALVRLMLGEKAQTALIREVRWSVYGDFIEHIDLARVAMEDEVKLAVPIHVDGVPKGASTGGQLEIVIRDLEVFSRVDSIPTEIRVDVSDLAIGDGIHADELPLPANVRLALHARDLILHCVPPKKIEDETAGEGEAAEGELAAPAADKAADES